MKLFLLELVLRVLLALLVEHTRFRDVIAWVVKAEGEYDNSLSKRGYVYRAIRDREPGLSQPAINILLELGVLIINSRSK